MLASSINRQDPARDKQSWKGLWSWARIW
jgi:hypothetical protein